MDATPHRQNWRHWNVYPAAVFSAQRMDRLFYYNTLLQGAPTRTIPTKTLISSLKTHEMKGGCA